MIKKTVIKCEHYTRTYYLDAPKNHNGRFTKEPRVMSRASRLDPGVYKEIEGELPTHLDKILIGEDFREIVCRAIDLDDLETEIITIQHHHETAVNKAEAEAEYAEVMKDYTEQAINDDEQLKSLCKLLKIEPREADLNELRKVIKKPTYPLSGGHTHSIEHDHYLGYIQWDPSILSVGPVSTYETSTGVVTTTNIEITCDSILSDTIKF